MYKRWGILFSVLTVALSALAQEPPVPEPEPEVLTASVVRADDHYIRSFLKNLSRSLSKNDPESAPDWRSRLYTKIELDVTEIEDVIDSKLLRKDLGFVMQYADSSALPGKVCVPVLFSENQSEVFHSQSPSFNREFMRASHISGLEDDNVLRQFTGSYLLKANFFKPSIELLNLTIPNPADEGSQIFYNYYLVDSLQVEGRKTYVLRFHPKKLVTSPTLDGEMLIDAEDYGIRSVKASLSQKSNVNWIRHLDLDIENRRLANGMWFYGRERTMADLSITTSDNSFFPSVIFRRDMYYSLPVYEPLEDRDQLQKENAVVMRDVIRGDEQAWRTMRTVPLSPREKGIFDMVSHIQDQPFYKWTYAFLDTVLTGYYEIKPWHIEIGRWERTFSKNEAEGLRLQFGGRTLYTFSEKIRLSAYAAYGFQDHKWKGQTQAEWMLGRERTRKFTVTFKEDYERLGSGSGVFSAPNMFSSFLVRADANRQTLVRTGDILYQHEFSPSVNAEIQWTTQRMWSNPDVPIYSVDGTHTVLESMGVNQLHVAMRFSYDERVNRSYFKKTYLFTRFPVLAIGVTGGFKGITENDFNFVRADGYLEWKIPTSAIGYGKLFINGGCIWGSVPHTLLKQHKGNTTYLLDKSAFSCMDAYEFASDRWIEGYYQHNFDGFFLGKIPLIKKLDLREVAMVRFAWGDLTEQNKQNVLQETGVLTKPYVEAGFGISNIFRLFRVDCYWRLTHIRPEANKNFSVNFGFDLEF